MLQQCVNVRQMYRGGRVVFAEDDALRLSMMIDPAWSIAAPNSGETPRLEATRKKTRDLIPMGEAPASNNSNALSAIGTLNCEYQSFRHPPQQLMDDCRTSFFGWTQNIRRYGAIHSFRRAGPLAPNEYKLPIGKTYRSCRWTLEFLSFAWYADEESNWNLELAGAPGLAHMYEPVGNDLGRRCCPGRIWFHGIDDRSDKCAAASYP